MLSVALVRPVWWIACRSVRFVTALVLMGLLLGAGGARIGLSDPAFPAGGARPAAAQSTLEDVRAEAPAAGTAAEAPRAALRDVSTIDERSVATGSVPTVLVQADLLSGQPDRPVVGSTAVGPPTGDAYARVVGPRAPPLD